MRLLTALLIGGCLTATGALAESTRGYVMSDASSPRSSHQEENLPPGYSWLEIIKRPTPEAFAAAFTKDVILDASVLPRSITGATDVRAFFGATRAMFDAIAFKHEVTAGSRTYLEWEGTFQGNNIAGLTLLMKDATGLIESLRVYYRLYNVVIAFSADLAGRLAGNMTEDPFLGSALRGVRHAAAIPS
jgi:hypothetical protein